ncbi:ABC transporter permease [Thiorhodovibrio frisius]|uniref:Putative ABC-type transport system involved in lysophospholipase L1 biosynthesis, permease component n=1 Tax=Thiorhodovibrio frisius TaxID=631362 RepID=H8Z4L9_9GAMM|nr:putative ABC-type transport system involved in lysophospholipase L1 biosynthesis, permease component [Thiorhodovibrio frisius]WPL21013.1 outer membrane-specific lipoprotein transporter subunit LolE [Thiorhodovibrio frisius]
MRPDHPFVSTPSAASNAAPRQNAWRLALRLLGRDWRGGELGLLLAALVLTVAAVTAVGFFTDSIATAIERQGGDLLAADLVIASSQPVAESLRAQAEQQGLVTAETLSFRSVVLAGEKTQLVQAKAISPSYPLRGRLRIQRALNGPSETMSTGPTPGSAWVEAPLLHALGLTIGDSLRLGEQPLRIDAIIAYEPDRGGGFAQFAPRVMIAAADLPGTGLITPASRVDYRLLLAGEPASLRAFRDWAGSHLTPDAELQSAQDARPELASASDRAARFLHLAALTTVLVAGAAVALASRRFVERQTDAVAVMRALGAPRGLLARLFAWRLLGLGLIASTLGCLLGYLGQQGLLLILGDWFGERLPPPSLRPLALGYGTGLIALAGFALPPLVQLARVPPLRVLRRDLGAPPASLALAIGAAVAALAALLLWLADDADLALRVLGGTLGAIAALAGLGTLMVYGARIAARRARGIWRLGLAGIGRRPAQSVMQLCGFGIGLLALLLLAVVRVDLLRDWQASLPEGAPNRFLINIQPGEVEPLREFFSAAGIDTSGLYPMVRGRLRAIGERVIDEETYDNPRAERLARREFNLSFASDLQSDNLLTAGSWWPNDQAPAQFSVEEGIAETLDIARGDIMHFWVAGKDISGPVTSLREVQWDSFNVNFFVIAPPAALSDQPATWVTSFYLPPGRDGWIPELLASFPSVTVIDIDALLTEVRGVIDQGIQAVEYVFGFTLLAGLLVMIAGIQASLGSRRAEQAVLRTLGAGRAPLLRAIMIEFTTLGLLAGLLASAFAALIGWLLATQVFDLPYGIDPWLWLVGVPGSALLIGIAGTLASWGPLVRPPLSALRAGN